MNLPNNFYSVLTFLTALICALNAGLFFVFSNTIMKALGRIAPSEGISAMQSMNAVILNPWFFFVFFGTSLFSLALIALSLMGQGGNAKMYVLAGSIIFIVGCTLTTMIFNVPMNTALDAAAPTASESIEIWKDYLVRWTFWNHIRTAAAIAATALLMLGLYQQP